ncbi:unnamed protein product [Pelagomonas calceolata]|uniref:Uncharacterized protein n=1 Tax=Pelagomonas calceolata TaxID=35677 RepID=A0A7S4A7H0_9STRA|nr:unnamed protein product [Pelagomonas calceolata]|mmetsp:Transcript_8809/g.27510  ORF Transcript_8809/g.27510 Transcript_8809/m.27510 type:complete len:251 (+) Transcript_8809:160-912(+)
MSDSDSESYSLESALLRAALATDLAALRRALATDVTVDPDQRSPGELAAALRIIIDTGSPLTITSQTTASNEVRLQCIEVLLDAGASPNVLDLYAPLTLAAARGNTAIVNRLLRAGADPKYANPLTGWSAIHAAVFVGSVSCATALVKAGADLEAVWTGHTPLLAAVHYRQERMCPILLRGGARLDLDLMAEQFDRTPFYLQKVEYAGGWKKYEQAHRKRLTTTFAKGFPRLPVDAISHMVDFAFHVGFY